MFLLCSSGGWRTGGLVVDCQLVKTAVVCHSDCSPFSVHRLKISEEA